MEFSTVTSVHCTFYAWLCTAQRVHAQIQETGSFIFHALCFASVSMFRPAMLKLPGLGIVYCTNVRADRAFVYYINVHAHIEAAAAYAMTQ